MSSQTEKKCCVCGMPSTMRCSACAQAGVDLFFCSSEHQKLVWFAHKPVCGPLKADFGVVPDLTPFETRILQLPALLQTLPKRRALGTASTTIDQAIVGLERDYRLIPGSFMRNVNRMNEWLESLATPPGVRWAVRIIVNSALCDFLHSQDGIAHDPLELPAHAFALNCYAWLSATQPELPWPQLRTFVHGATVWAGLLRVVAGRVNVAGSNTSFVTPDFVGANLERLLQTMQADLNFIDVTGGGLLQLVSQPLRSVPAMSRFSVQLATLGDRASNRISVTPPGHAAERYIQTVQERFFPNAT